MQIVVCPSVVDCVSFSRPSLSNIDEVFVRIVVNDIQSGRFEISLVVVEKSKDNICRISPQMNENSKSPLTTVF